MNAILIRSNRWRLPLLCILTSGACLLGSESGSAANEDTQNLTGPEPRRWLVDDIQPRVAWQSEELAVPIMLASIDRDSPPAYISPLAPEAGEQGSQASGVAWAAGYAAASVAFRARSFDDGYLCSPAFIYNRLNGGRNQGIALLDTLNYLKLAGCSDMRFMAYRNDDILTQPGLAALEDGLRRRIRGFARIEIGDPEQVRGHLLQGRLVMALLRVTENFFKLKEPSWDGPVGNHWAEQAVAVIGFEQARRVYLIQNSQGVQWGRDGRAEISYDWFSRLAEKAYVLW